MKRDVQGEIEQLKFRILRLRQALEEIVDPPDFEYSMEYAQEVAEAALAKDKVRAACR